MGKKNKKQNKNRNKKTIYIQGMTCVSCEILIKDELDNHTSIKSVEVCHKTNKTQLELHDNNLDLSEIQNKIESLGYNTSHSPFQEKVESKFKATKKQWVFALFVVFILYKIFIAFQKSGMLNSLELGNESVGYGAAFLIGIVASLSTCLAIIGAVVISFGAKYESHGTKFERTVKPHLLFHAGRIGIFFVLGGVLGMIGSVIKISPTAMGWFSVLIALILIWLGLNILGKAPSITKVGLHMPKGLLKHWKRLQNSEHKYAPMILGGFTFFLPCGFTQSMQLFAMGSGSFWTGGMTLAFFAIGTTPVLLGIGILSSKSKNKKNILFKLTTGIIIILFGWYTLSAGFAVLGYSLPSFGSGNSKADISTNGQQNQSMSQIQNVYMAVDYSGYTPNTIRIKNNVPVNWIIDVKQMSGCTNEIIVPNLRINKKLKLGKNIVQFTPKRLGRLGFSCWMGMVRGTFIVE